MEEVQNTKPVLQSTIHPVVYYFKTTANDQLKLAHNCFYCVCFEFVDIFRQPDEL